MTTRYSLVWISLDTLLPHWLSICCCKTNIFFIHSFGWSYPLEVDEKTHPFIYPFGYSNPLEVVKKLRYFHLFIHPLEIGIILSFSSWQKDHYSTTNALLSNEQQDLMVKERWEKTCKTAITFPHHKPMKKMSSWNVSLQRLAQMF
jgi:hypothetical protein